MIKTEADLARLTHRQREVLTALARRLSNNEVARLLHIAEATPNIDAEALLRAFATAQEALSRSESSTTELIA
jgi:DNA-binding NarL/FixJ family response regulator